MTTRGQTCRVLATWALLAAIGLAQEGGEDESGLERARRDQGRIGLRLQSLREKLERLAERYRVEGHDRNSQLLAEAMTRFDAASLLDTSRDAEQGLASAMLSSVERQEQLIEGLLAIETVLRDRRDVDELRERTNQLNEGIAELGRLASEQRQLLSQSQAAADRPAALVADAQQQAAALQQAIGRARAAGELLAQGEGVLGEAALAEWLAQEQRALADAVQPSAAAQAELGEALAALQRSLGAPLDAPGAEELMAAAEAQRQRAAVLAGQAQQAMEQARALLSGESPSAPVAPADAAPAPVGALTGEASAAGAAPTSDPSASGAVAPSGDPASAGEGTPASAADPSSEASAPAPSSAGDAAPAGGAPPAGDATPAGGAPPAGEAPPAAAAPGAAPDSGRSGEPAAGSTSADPTSAAVAAQERAPADAANPAGPAEGADPDAAADAALERAAELTEQLAAALAEGERAANAARNRGVATLGAAERAAREQAEALNQTAQRLEAAEPQEGPELLDRTRELLAGVERAAQSSDAGDRQGADATLAGAAQDLAALQALLAQRAQRATDAPAAPRDEAARAAAVAAQQDLEQRLRQLMERLSELPDQGFQEPAGRAGSAMEAGAESIAGGDDARAASSQEQAAEELESAQEQLQGDRDRYEQVRQGEVLFQLGEELQALLDGQVALNGETTAVAGERSAAGEDRLSRSQRRTVARLAEDERLLAARARAAAEALSEDGAVAFVFALGLSADDMETVAARLAEEDTGPVVQALQRGIQQRLADLIAVLEDELERRRQALREDAVEPAEPGQPASGPPPLVPPVAELLLVQRMELFALSRLAGFRQLLESGPARDDGLQARDVQVLERWASEHARITELFQSLIPAPPPPEAFPPLDELEMPPGRDALPEHRR